jgi:AdoMet-dependent rRNA methyltransferase SPB1
MGVGTIKIGIDLVPIKPIPGVITYAEDITSPRCLQLVKKASIVSFSDQEPN